MIVTTMNDIPGYVIDEVYGEVMGLTVRSRNVGSQMGASLKSMLGGELKGMTKALVDEPAGGDGPDGRRGGGEGRERDRRDALRHVRDGRQWTEICAYGTAVRARTRPNGRQASVRSCDGSVPSCLARCALRRQSRAAPARVVQRDPVAPEGAARREQPLAERAAELVERSPAGGRDLVGVVRRELLVLRLGEEDVRPPRQLAARVAEQRLRRDEIAAELHVQPRLLERLPHRAGDEVLARLDAAARRTPDVLRERAASGSARAAATGRG